MHPADGEGLPSRLRRPDPPVAPLTKFVEQPLRSLDAGKTEAFDERIVDRRKQELCLLVLAAIAPQPS